jgi:hypothetical protein
MFFPKRGLTSNGLHGVTSRKMELSVLYLHVMNMLALMAVREYKIVVDNPYFRNEQSIQIRLKLSGTNV